MVIDFFDAGHNILFAGGKKNIKSYQKIDIDSSRFFR